MSIVLMTSPLQVNDYRCSGKLVTRAVAHACPLMYVQLKLRRRVFNTAAAHLRAIQAFYSYAKSRYLDKGCALRQGDAWHRVGTAQLKPSSLIVTAPLLVCTDLQDSVMVMALHN